MVNVDAVAGAVRDLLIATGAPLNEHTAETPTRSAKAWAHMLSGYSVNPDDHLDKTFPVEGDPGLVMVSGIEVHSTCAHHLLPITGLATVAYRPQPTGRVVGLSKLSRVLEGYARRLQVQEQLGNQVLNALRERLNPVNATVLITAEHGCMTIRGVQQSGTVTETVASWGAYEAGELDRITAAHHRSLR